jgi:hypothetical protein
MEELVEVAGDPRDGSLVLQKTRLLLLHRLLSLRLPTPPPPPPPLLSKQLAERGSYLPKREVFKRYNLLSRGHCYNEFFLLFLPPPHLPEANFGPIPQHWHLIAADYPLIPKQEFLLHLLLLRELHF